MKSLKLSVCDVTKAHCEACRDGTRGPVLWDQWSKVFVMPGEWATSCPRKLSPGWTPTRGLGDVVAKAIKVATFGKVKECGGCRKRREAMNKLLPYKPKD